MDDDDACIWKNAQVIQRETIYVAERVGLCIDNSGNHFE
jgi:hypothetical protein